MISVDNLPTAGQFLISEPFMADRHFKRSVILLCDSTAEGAVGFIVNKPLSLKIQDVITDFPAFNAPVYFGGPVQPDTLHYVHSKGDIIEGSEEIGKNLYWGGNFEVIRLMIEQGLIEPDEIKFFIGYSGWGPGQLLEEMKENSWILTPASQRNVFGPDNDILWQQVLENKGGKYSMIARFPESPVLN